MVTAQLCPTLCDPMDYSLPGSSVHWIFQARILEWVAISFPRVLPTQGLNLGLLHCRQILFEPPGKPIVYESVYNMYDLCVFSIIGFEATVVCRIFHKDRFLLSWTIWSCYFCRSKMADISNFIRFNFTERIFSYNDGKIILSILFFDDLGQNF